MPDLWYCLHTHAAKEQVAVRHVLNQGFMAYMPQFRPKWAKGDQRRPLFPGYIFVKFDARLDRWQPLNNTEGVKYLLQSSIGVPAPMPANLVDNIRHQLEQENAAFDIAVVPPAPDEGRQAIRAGQKVRVAEGHYFYGGIEGLCAWSTSRRIQLLMDLAGGKVTITLARDQVEVLPDA